MFPTTFYSLSLCFITKKVFDGGILIDTETRTKDQNLNFEDDVAQHNDPDAAAVNNPTL
jgi:hypothetical protein